jgi:phage/conjugal plasmid C-4 type zinc finger TraR family protein
MSEVKKTDLMEAKKKLQQRKLELEEQLSDLYKGTAFINPGDVQDPGDQAQSLSLETTQISLQNAELHEYNMITQALTMIDEGTYGTCLDCGQPISEKRLKLYPNATRCLPCQEVFEERRKE